MEDFPFLVQPHRLKTVAEPFSVTTLDRRLTTSGPLGSLSVGVLPPAMAGSAQKCGSHLPTPSELRLRRQKAVI